MLSIDGTVKNSAAISVTSAISKDFGIVGEYVTFLLQGVVIAETEEGIFHTMECCQEETSLTVIVSLTDSIRMRRSNGNAYSRKGPNSSHKIAVKSCHDLTNQLQHIEKIVEKQTSQQVAKNHLRLKTMIDAVQWLTFQACAFRGRNESHGSNNRGNVIELIKLLAFYNMDVVDVVLHKAPQNTSYYSHRIQKEILRACLEYFFDIVHVSDTTSATLKEEICIVLSRHNLSVQNIRGQGYDGASNMRGEWTGLQALFLHDCHFAHDQLKVDQAKEIISKLAIDEVETDADGVYDKITSFEFVFILHLMRDIMGTTDDLCQALQRKSQDILNAMHLVSTTKALVQKYREDGRFPSLENVQLFCGKYDIEIPDMSARYTFGRGHDCHQRDHITIEHHFRVDIFIIICDSQLQELNNRFKKGVMEMLVLSFALDPRDDYSSFKIENMDKLANQFYLNDFTEQEKIHLILQVQNYKIDILKYLEFQQLLTISNLCQMLVKTKKSTIYPLVNRLIRLALTFLVSMAATERAFLAMKIVKTRLRNRIEDGFFFQATC
ncbi:uncharacterized protein LOC114306840 [Camellia sinensis]|uniref:uncharacterized protein LOC114306840 n=1 Tax=Camellia sinensis TaxID=4442 RepID=UPI001035A5F9|nr:uncharacterized protein LOC114306840 [Camellia sinensis]